MLMDFDLIIKNGTVIDGTGIPGENRDIGIKDDKIAFLDHRIPANNFPTIDASGLIVAPGFIDIRSHSYFLWLIRPESHSTAPGSLRTDSCRSSGVSAGPSS